MIIINFVKKERLIEMIQHPENHKLSQEVFMDDSQQYLPDISEERIVGFVMRFRSVTITLAEDHLP